MSWTYITTIKPPIEQNFKVPGLLKEYFKEKYNITLPEDFGPQGSIPIPKSKELLLLFTSIDEDFGTLLILESPQGEGWRTEYIVYGSLITNCLNCSTNFEDHKYKFCPYCGIKLTHSF